MFLSFWPARAWLFPHARVRLRNTPACATSFVCDLPLTLSRRTTSCGVMSGPVSFHLPVDASLHNFNSLDYGFSAKESSFVGSDATCGAGARAFSQYLNFEQPMRTSVSWVGTPGMLAVPAPSEAGVVRERDAPANRDRPLWEEQQLGVETRDAHGRTGVAEDVSTSQTFQEVRVYPFITLTTHLSPSISQFYVHSTPRASFSGDKHLTRLFVFLASRQTIARHRRLSLPRTLATWTRNTKRTRCWARYECSQHAQPHDLPTKHSYSHSPNPQLRLVSEATNTSLRLSMLSNASDNLFPTTLGHSPISCTSQGPLRTLSARTFEALLDESNVKENEVRVEKDILATRPPVASSNISTCSS